jgi:hypothetical protein
MRTVAFYPNIVDHEGIEAESGFSLLTGSFRTELSIVLFDDEVIGHACDVVANHSRQ